MSSRHPSIPGMTDPCPCGLPADYTACCGRFHAGEEPPTALEVMRARYSAFVKRHATFLIRTSHPVDRAKLDPRGLRTSFALDWAGLEIVAHDKGQPGDSEGMVHFKASIRVPGGAIRIHEERSRFSRAAGCWVYRDARG